MPLLLPALSAVLIFRTVFPLPAAQRRAGPTKRPTAPSGVGIAEALLAADHQGISSPV